MSLECARGTPGERCREKYSRKPIAYSLLCILCIIINISVFNAVGKPKAMTWRDVARLRRPNPFINLDTTDAFNPPVEPILLYPVLLSQINKAEPSHAYGVDPVIFTTWGRTEPPVDREFKVTASVSTIVEFRSIDYGMEKCRLFLTVPAAPNRNSTFHLGSGENWVDIWRLNVSYPMDKKRLSWNSRPSRAAQLDKVAIAPGMNYTYQFSCPSDSLHAFEFSAADESTAVVWSQDHSDPNPAVLVIQYPSQGKLVAMREHTKASEFKPLDTSQPPLPWFIPRLEHVAMRIIPRTPRYKLGSEAWNKQLPSGGHTIHLANPDQSLGTYTVAMFHQLRCLEILQTAYLDEGSHQESSLSQHCMNYLRQTLLCQMDLRNEEQGSTPTHNGVDALCYDWEPIYEEAEKNFDAYAKYNSQGHNYGT